MIKLIVNADDFGFSRGVNYGIIDAYQDGIVNSTTMMVNTPGTEHAVKLAKQHPGLAVGIHLTLTFGKAVSNNVPSITDNNNFFRIDKNYHNPSGIIVEEVEQEWDAQIQKFLSYGLVPTHLDSHHHIHSWSVLTPVIQRLTQKYQLPVRNIFENPIKDVITYSDIFTANFYGDNISIDFFDNLYKELPNEESVTIEVMCHPAYIDTFLKENSSYCDKRLEELDILTKVTLPG
jgi:chitin disaccharide deacetylase